MTQPLVLESDAIRVEIDAGRGADILSVTHRDTEVQVLFSTPWSARADAIRQNEAKPHSSDSRMSWMEQYRGGWQTLFPNAGDPRSIGGAEVGFHGELSTSPWRVEPAEAGSARLATELFTVPVAIERHVTLTANTLEIFDTLRNLSVRPVTADYVSHPAFGGVFLDGSCSIDTGAQTFTVDSADTASGARPGSAHQWPWLDLTAGGRRDLRRLSLPGQAMGAFGWLGDFKAPWASVTNNDLGLTALLEWDSSVLPYAWFWEELNGETDFPWFGRTRVIALEPASTQTSGPSRSSVFALGPLESKEVGVRLSIITIDQGVSDE